MTGKKGDTIHIPKPYRGVATAKAAKTAVTIQADTEGEVQVVIDKHFEYSRMIEDILKAQALSSLRQFYTGDAGYALAKQVDNDLFTLGKSFGDGDGSDWTNSATFIVNSGGTGVEAYAGAGTVNAFTDAGFRALIQKMDDADVPMDNRSFVVPPSLRNAIMGVERYVSSDFVDGRSVQNGKIGNLYGIDVFTTSNCPLTTRTTVKAAFLVHKDTMVWLSSRASAHRLSTSRSSWVRFTPQTLCTVLRRYVRNQVLYWL